MKRLLLLTALGAAAWLVPAPANAGHPLCVSLRGRDVVCAPTVDYTSEDPICIYLLASYSVCV